MSARPSPSLYVVQCKPSRHRRPSARASRSPLSVCVQRAHLHLVQPAPIPRPAPPPLPLPLPLPNPLSLPLPLPPSPPLRFLRLPQRLRPRPCAQDHLHGLDRREARRVRQRQQLVARAVRRRRGWVAQAAVYGAQAQVEDMLWLVQRRQGSAGVCMGVRVRVRWRFGGVVVWVRKVCCRCGRRDVEV